ncbi:MAG: protein kinase [Planctomycetes bacterium]|nr:protein kinase [Planctomycetota bacterium]
MSGDVPQECPHREAVEALAHDALAAERRGPEQKHLEECEPCRAMFRKTSSGWFPRMRNYTVVERIGEGGFGVVYKAIHHAKQRTEALKVLFTKTPIFTAYFENEVHLIARLRHPNIATLYEAHLNTLPLYYTMEFVEGEQLDECFTAKSVPIAERIRILAQVAGAIGYAHEQGVVHRDLKPQNILVDATGQPRIVDFGIAKKLGLSESDPDDFRDSPNHAVGTYGYIAPEQIAGAAVDGRADIYALGVLLYHSVTGAAARVLKHGDDFARRLRERDISRAEDLAAIIAHAVEEDPERRYATCGEFVEDLENYLAGKSVNAHKGGSVASGASRVATLVLRNHPHTVRFAVLVFIASLLTGTFWALHARRLESSAAYDLREAVLVTFTPSTLAAIRAGTIGADLPGLSATNFKSRRLLHGRLLQVLADAAPRAVIWDFYVPECRPEYDEPLLLGVRKLMAAGTPVVVGVGKFDINGKPLMCAHLLAEVHSYGALHGPKTDAPPGEYMIPVYLQRGLADPIPSLSVAGFAAARFPDARLEIRPGPQKALLSYKREKFEAGESEWRSEIDSVPVVFAGQEAVSMLLNPTDRVMCQMIDADLGADWPARSVLYEEVLSATADQLREWFQGRVVTVGQTIPPLDQHRTTAGTLVFGCQIQTLALDALLRGVATVPLSRPELAARLLIWCVLGGAAVGLMRVGVSVPMRVLVPVCLAVCAAGLTVGVGGTAFVSSRWGVEASIGLCGLLVTGSLAYLAEAVRERHLRIAPAPSWTAASRSTLTATPVTEQI